MYNCSIAGDNTPYRPCGQCANVPTGKLQTLPAMDASWMDGAGSPGFVGLLAVAELVLPFLSLRDVVCSVSVSKAWLAIASQPTTWKQLLCIELGLQAVPSRVSLCDFDGYVCVCFGVHDAHLLLSNLVRFVNVVYCRLPRLRQSPLNTSLKML